MISGSQWYQIMIWMKEVENNIDTTKGKYYISNATGKGYYSYITSTGSKDAYAVKNIFDLAGNVYEFTLEANLYFQGDFHGTRIFRSGVGYTAGEKNYSPTARDFTPPTNAISVFGSRFVLY